MSQKLMSRISWFVALFFIGAIIISFALTGIGSSRYSDSGMVSVAKVDGTSIDLEEYQRVFQGQLDYYSKIMGGKSLSSKDIELFGLKRRAIQQLVEQKLLLNLANDIELAASTKEIQAEIIDRPYFKTNDRFDILKYKQLLRANKFSPIDFEDKISEDLKFRKIATLLEGQMISKNFLTDLVTYKGMKADATAIKLYKDVLKQYVPVSANEIASFVADKANEGRLQTLYSANKEDFNVAEAVSARHILIKVDGKNQQEALKKINKIRSEVNTQNFKSMARKYTEDLSGKNNGGSLGEFKRGVMDPAFEKAAFSQKVGTISQPVKSSFGYHLIYVENHTEAKMITFENAKADLAKEILQSAKKEEFAKVSKRVGDELKTALQQNKGIMDLKEKYSFVLEQKKTINLLDSKIGTIELDDNQTAEIFKNGKANMDTFLFDNPNYILVVKTSAFKSKPNEQKEDDSLKNEESMQKFQIARKIRENMMKALQKNADVAIYAKML